jgi:cytochrome c oxidase subunit 5b
MLTHVTGTMKDPILVKSFGEEHYIGCTGVPADTHHQLWMIVSRERPIERCSECGNVIKMEYVGPTEDPHAHDHGDHGHGHESRLSLCPERVTSTNTGAAYTEPKTMADFVRPEFR